MNVKVAAIQMSMSWDQDANLHNADKLVKDAAKDGANIILLPELFMTPYFPQLEKYEYFDLASKLEDNQTIRYFQQVANQLHVVLPLSYFERSENVFYNSLVVIDADGSILGNYRKTHIPTGTNYEEKFYFTPGDTGIKVFKTHYGKIGIGICWDQWFPEVARILALQGAELICYPTAIGSEPTLPIDSRDHWQNVMKGHAGANLIPVIAANRVGTETAGTSKMTFYGSSFIANETGAIIKEMNRLDTGFISATFDLTAIKKYRYSWGVFRDRRPSMYRDILKK
ncbi:MAG TPA: N-carbamoylputrescine amidase [Firmicutes bacterium]|jgi:N-carbamoylputrescine amidase|nr:N-carbamoylputrescine amidase [Bacillota bacterium]